MILGDQWSFACLEFRGTQVNNPHQKPAGTNTSVWPLTHVEHAICERHGQLSGIWVSFPTSNN